MRRQKSSWGRARPAGVAVAAVCAVAGLVLQPAAGASASAGGGPATGSSGALAAGRYLAAQRAGYGTPAQRASSYEAAVLAGQGLRTAAIPAAGAAVASGTWSALGPAPMVGNLRKNNNSGFYAGPNSGRVDSLAIASNGRIYAGTAGGGVWSTTDGGAEWAPLTDHVPTGLAIGALAVDPANPSVVYAGTGEDNECGDCFPGNGVLESTNGGRTWKVSNPQHIFTGVDFASLVVDAAQPRDLFAGTSAGLFESTDGGASWAHPAGSATTAPTWGVVVDPSTAPATVYAAAFGVGIERSTDGGRTFAVVGGASLPPASSFGVTALGIGTRSKAHPDADKVLYAAVSLYSPSAPFGYALEMFKSVDRGTSWQQLKVPAYTNQSYAYGGGTADQSSYDNTLAVDPADPSHVLAGGIALVQTTDGGATWTNVNDGHDFFAPHTANVLHPDQHALVFAGASVLIGDDGGVYEDNSGNVANLNSNLDTGQFYEDLAVQGAGSQVLGGLQDNGTALYTGVPQWSETIAGDGGYNAINPLDPQQQFAEADAGLYATSDGWTTSPRYIEPKPIYDGTLPPVPGGPDPQLASNFVPPMTLVPNPAAPDQPTLYFGAANLWKSTNPLARTWTRVTSHRGSYVSAVAVAPSNPDVVYVGFDDGTVLVSDDATSATPTFTDISPGVALWITHISVDPTSAQRIALSYSDSNTQYQAVPPMVLTARITGGARPVASYTDVTGNLPAGVASNSVVFDHGDLVVATDAGVYTTPVSTLQGTGTSWLVAGTGLPNVQVIGLTLDTRGDIYAATHGRGVWRLTVAGS